MLNSREEWYVAKKVEFHVRVQNIPLPGEKQEKSNSTTNPEAGRVVNVVAGRKQADNALFFPSPVFSVLTILPSCHFFYTAMAHPRATAT